MKPGTLVSVTGVGKTYKLYKDPFDRVKEALNPFDRSYHTRFDALSDVTFQLRRGESLGVIGKNGHGKSTLLKIISGILQPTTGQVQVNGRVAAILELSSNLNAEVTGRRNVEIGLQIAGVAKHDRARKLDEIADFSEIGEFIDQPVKTYSSGMKSRLGFALATSVEPDVLILDEVLAVGDFEFQQKCLARMNEMRERMSVLFVSHSMNSVRHFCDNAMVLERGRIAFMGTADTAIEYYIEQQQQRKVELQAKQERTVAPFYGDLFHNPDKVTVTKQKWLLDTAVKTHSKLRFEFDFQLSYEPRQLIIGIPVWNVEKRELVTSITSDFNNEQITVENGRCRGTIDIVCQLNPGTYLSSFNVRDGVEFLYRQLNDEFMVADHRRSFGHFTHNAEWSFHSGP